MTKYQNWAQWHIFQALPACQPRCQRPPPGGCRHPPAPHACGAPGMVDETRNHSPTEWLAGKL